LESSIPLPLYPESPSERHDEKDSMTSFFASCNGDSFQRDSFQQEIDEKISILKNNDKRLADEYKKAHAKAANDPSACLPTGGPTLLQTKAKEWKDNKDRLARIEKGAKSWKEAHDKLAGPSTTHTHGVGPGSPAYNLDSARRSLNRDLQTVATNYTWSDWFRDHLFP